MASIQLTIAEPCHENWNNMLPEDKGRFCLSCQKTVIDFTAMSDRQVFEYFKNYQGNTCGQFSTDQLNREVTKPKNSGIGRWKYFWQILVPAVFALHKVEAQPKIQGKVRAAPVCRPVKEQPENITMGMVALPQQVQQPKYELSGKVINNKKEPVPFATVSSSDGKHAVADSLGQFKMILGEKTSLTISQVGYVTQNFTIDSLQTNHLSALKIENGRIVIETAIEINQAETKLTDVVVVGYGSESRFTSLAGGISVRISKSFFTKQKLVHPDRTLPQLKIFPNPIQPGQHFKIEFQVKKAGDYVLKVTEAGGKVLIERQLLIAGKVQTETINGSALQRPGIYLITLTNPANQKGNALNGRIVVQ